MESLAVAGAMIIPGRTVTSEKTAFPIESVSLIRADPAAAGAE